MTTLAMFSGGLDSTAMLVKLLAETQDELRVHHIRMANKEKRDAAEQRIRAPHEDAENEQQLAKAKLKRKK